MKFTIKKGKHYSSNLLARLNFLNFKNPLSYEVTFALNCWYEYVNTDSEDLNKLFGFGGADHHKNSFRLCWKPDFEDKGSIIIFAYWYDDQERNIKEFGVVSTGETLRFEIKANGSGYIVKAPFGIKHYPASTPRPIWKKLFPYFGGDNKAPKTMTITLNK